jgi:O-6-methylguanine DNA methyltransferase
MTRLHASKPIVKWTQVLIETPDGAFLSYYSERGLVSLSFPTTVSHSATGYKKVSASLTSQIRQWHQQTQNALRNSLSGRPAGTLPPLDWEGYTEFQKQVWTALINIPCGSTTSYAQIGSLLGKPKAARAIGGACGANPIPILVPCHRVVSATGLGGYSGGLEWKKLLLGREQKNGALNRSTPNTHGSLSIPDLAP